MSVVGGYTAFYGELVVWDARERFEPGVDVGTDGRYALLLGLGRGVLSDRFSPPFLPILGDLLV